MKLESLINRLELQKQGIEAELKVLRKYTETATTAKKIVLSMKPSNNGRKWTSRQRAKFRKTMRAKRQRVKNVE